MEGVYEHLGAIPHSGTVAAIRLWPGMAKKAEEVLRLCGKERLGLVSEELPGGALFIACHGASVGVSIPGTKITTYKVEMNAPLANTGSDRYGSVVCAYEADSEAITKRTAEICRSLHKR